MFIEKLNDKDYIELISWLFMADDKIPYYEFSEDYQRVYVTYSNDGEVFGVLFNDYEVLYSENISKGLIKERQNQTVKMLYNLFMYRKFGHEYLQIQFNKATIAKMSIEELYLDILVVQRQQQVINYLYNYLPYDDYYKEYEKAEKALYEEVKKKENRILE